MLKEVIRECVTMTAGWPGNQRPFIHFPVLGVYVCLFPCSWHSSKDVALGVRGCWDHLGCVVTHTNKGLYKILQAELQIYTLAVTQDKSYVEMLCLSKLSSTNLGWSASFFCVFLQSYAHSFRFHLGIFQGYEPTEVLQGKIYNLQKRKSYVLWKYLCWFSFSLSNSLHSSTFHLYSFLLILPFTWIMLKHLIGGFQRGSVAKNPPVKQMRIWFLGWEDPRRKKWQPTSLFMHGKLRGQRILADYSPRGPKRVFLTKH